MRRLLAAITLVLVAVALAACGGGESTDGAVTTTAPPPPTSVSSSNSSDTLSPNEVVLNEQFPTSETSVPSEILSRLQNKQPMMIVYIDSEQIITTDQLAEIDAVMNDYRGLIDMIQYDVGEGLAMKQDSNASDLSKAMALAGPVNASHAPYILFVDRSGRVTGRFSGFTDRKLLEREVLRATS